MAKARKLTASERDGVQYNRAKRWQIVMAMGSNSTAMAFSSLLGLISYLANSGYGIMVAAVGMVLTACRVFDGVVDPFLALLIDRVNTRFGKIRLFMSIGFLIRTVAVYMLYIWGSGRFGMPFFIVMYLLYILGNSIGDVAGNMITPILTNDPSQRPFVGFWGMVHSALSAMVFGLVITLVILPQYGNQYNNEMLAASCVVYVGIAFFFFVMSMIGVAAHDKPENFRNIKEGEVGYKDMLSLVKDNRPFQMYTIAAVTDKIATQAAGQAIVGTMLYGILMGSVQFGSIINIVANLPATFLTFIGARYVAKYGARKGTVTWAWVGIAFAAAGVLFCLLAPMERVLSTPVLLIVYVLLVFGFNFGRLNGTTASNVMRSDIVDYELDRSGNYMAATVSATYNFIDQIVSSLGTLIATLCVAAIGYTTVMPQPTDEATFGIRVVTAFLNFGMPIIGWICSIIAMKFYKLTKEEMVHVQKRVAEKKATLKEM